MSVNSPGGSVSLVEEFEGAIDLLLTDVIMPVMNGRDLSEKLLSVSPSLKCMFMSGYTSNIIAQHGVLDVNTHFIQKPFSKDQLARKIRQVLDLKQRLQTTGT